MRKKWQKPKLIVLVRGEPGERVLNGCKTASGAGASLHNDGCFVEGAPAACGARGDLGIGNAIVCNDCSGIVNS
jgi:hypothetical protein